MGSPPYILIVSSFSGYNVKMKMENILLSFRPRTVDDLHVADAQFCVIDRSYLFYC